MKSVGLGLTILQHTSYKIIAYYSTKLDESIGTNMTPKVGRCFNSSSVRAEAAEACPSTPPRCTKSIVVKVVREPWGTMAVLIIPEAEDVLGSGDLRS